MKERERDVLAHDRGGLHDVPLLGREPVDARGEDRAHGGRDFEGLDVVRGSIGAGLTDQRPRLDERPDGFLEEEGIAFGPLDQQPPERAQRDVVADELTHQRFGARRRQRIKVKLRVRGSARDGVPVFRSITDDHEGAGGGHAHGQALDETVFEGTVELRVDGRDPRRVSVGDAWHNPRGAIHELRNVGDTPVRVVNTLVLDKGKPKMQPAQ